MKISAKILLIFSAVALLASTFIFFSLRQMAATLTSNSHESARELIFISDVSTLCVDTYHAVKHRMKDRTDRKEIAELLKSLTGTMEKWLENEYFDKSTKPNEDNELENAHLVSKTVEKFTRICDSINGLDSIYLDDISTLESYLDHAYFDIENTLVVTKIHEVIEFEEAAHLTDRLSSKYILIGIVSAVLLIFILAIIVNRTFVNPVLELEAASEKVGRGEFVPMRPLMRRDELGKLVLTFNSMVYHLNKLVEEKGALLKKNVQSQLMSSLINSISNEIHSVNSDLRIITYNQAFENRINDIFPGGLEEDLPVYELLSELGPCFSKDNYQKSLNGIKYTENYKLISEESSFWYEVTFNPIYDPDGKVVGVSVFNNDVTALQSKNLELEQINKRLVLAKKEAETANKAKSAFLANMSHEIRTPLNSVLGFSEILSMQVEDAKHLKYLATIRSSGKGLLQLINDILDLSKIEAGEILLQKAGINPSVLLRELKATFSLNAEKKKIAFNLFQSHEFNDSYLLDELKIRQILTNLISNAIKFTDAGSVTLSYSVIDKENTADLTFVVSDTGIGIEESNHERIFSSFTQQEGQDERKYGGTGLGLTITKKLLDLMNGDISVESKPGHGSTFTVILRDAEKIAHENKPLSASDTTNNDQLRFNHEKVMIVDDVKDNRDVVLLFLEDLNLELIEAHNGQQAVDLAIKFKPDLIFMDLRMPVMDGYEATKQIKGIKGLENTPVVAISATVLESQAENDNDCFDGYLSKPVQINDIFAILKTHLS